MLSQSSRACGQEPGSRGAGQGLEAGERRDDLGAVEAREGERQPQEQWTGLRKEGDLRGRPCRDGLRAA